MSICINPRCLNPQNPDDVFFCQTCGSQLLLKGRYRISRVLGGGGFGKTYEITSQGTSKVLKVLINNSRKAVELFKREAQVLSQINDAGIPKVESDGYFVFHPRDSQEPLHCLIMEKIEGNNLREYIQQRGRPIDEEVAIQWLTELVTILQKVHSLGIFHRDIKPQNIILRSGNQKLVLIDFGAVREGSGTEVATGAKGLGEKTEVATHAGGGTSISSTGYTPIEQLNGQAVAQSDFFAIGRTFVYLLTGKEPTDKTIYDAFNDELNWRKYASGVTTQVADLIDSMMARLPRERPATAQVILQKLEEIKKSLYPEATVTVTPVKVINQTEAKPVEPSANPATGTGVVSGIVTFLFLIVGGLFFFLTTQPSNRSIDPPPPTYTPRYPPRNSGL